MSAELRLFGEYCAGQGKACRAAAGQAAARRRALADAAADPTVLAVEDEVMERLEDDAVLWDQLAREIHTHLTDHDDTPEGETHLW